MIQSYTLVDYLQQADLLLDAEKARLEKALNWPGFEQKLLQVFQEEILMKYQMQLINGNAGLITLFNQNNYEALKLIYKLYQPVNDGLKPIADKFKLQLINHGKNLLQSTETTSNGKDIPLKTILVNSELVEKTLHTLTSNRNMIEQCFESDTLFDR